LRFDPTIKYHPFPCAAARAVGGRPTDLLVDLVAPPPRAHLRPRHHHHRREVCQARGTDRVTGRGLMVRRSRDSGGRRAPEVNSSRDLVQTRRSALLWLLWLLWLLRARAEMDRAPGRIVLWRFDTNPSRRRLLPPPRAVGEHGHEASIPEPLVLPPPRAWRHHHDGHRRALPVVRSATDRVRR
jgi:hypothetical protein